MLILQKKVGLGTGIKGFVADGDLWNEGVGIAVDSSSNVHFTTRYNTNSIGITGKINSVGTSLWQHKLTDVRVYDIALDSNGNVYMVGQYTGQTPRPGIIVKYNSSGVLQWQRFIDTSASCSLDDVAVDSNDDVYVVGSPFGSSAIFLKINPSTGATIWDKSIGSATSYMYAVHADGSDIFIGGYDNLSQGQLLKFNTSGTALIKKEFGESSHESLESVTTDSSGNIILSGLSSLNIGQGHYAILTMKYNSSGVLQWQRLIGDNAADIGNSVVTDSSGNIYVVGYSTNTANSRDRMTVFKYDSSGTLLFQRFLQSTGSHDVSGQDVAISNDENHLHIAGVAEDTARDDTLLIKLPTDGSGLDNYGTELEYVAGDLVAVNPTFSDDTSTISVGTWGATNVAGTAPVNALADLVITAF